jgi:hypothetical protein
MLFANHNQLCHAPLERFTLHCLFFLLIYCPDGAKKHFALITRSSLPKPKQLCHAPLERFAFLSLFFLLIYCPDGARMSIAPEGRYIIRLSLPKQKHHRYPPLERFTLHSQTLTTFFPNSPN